MQFSSAGFLIFLPAVVILYYLLPQRARNPMLLCASYFFYILFSPAGALVLAFVTFSAYLSGIFLEKAAGAGGGSITSKKRLCAGFGVAVNIGVLFFLKYINMALSSISWLLGLFGAGAPALEANVILPVGISFYTLQAVSYTIDVYRGAVKPQKDIVKFALFVAFFPFLISGPIQKSKDFLPQLDEVHEFDYERVKKGAILIVFGYFQKLVIADRAGVVVDKVYGSPSAYCGSVLLFATLLFIVQLYADFAGYSNIAIGVAEMLGFRINKNFNHPYFSKSVAEFWRRWHIALSSWFKEYLYIPLGGNRRGKLKKYRNVMIVFLLSGLWHGASWNYVAWGFLHGVYQILGYLLLPVRDRIAKLLRFDRETAFGRLVRVFINFTLVGFAWIFFRAGSLKTALAIVAKIFTAFYPSAVFSKTLLALGLNARSLALLFAAVLVLISLSLIGRKGDVRDMICRQRLLVRWAIYIAFTLSVLIFGMYGPGFNPQSFIYAQF